MARKTLFEIPVSDITRNPHNPRLFFDELGLSELKKSIEKVGILVPLTLYENNKKTPKEKYILLDGERRWRCAKELGFEKVPANVIDEPDDATQNILFMFNIHHYRKEWELFPTALKLDVLMKKLDSEQEAQLANYTGLSRTMIRRCKKLLWYPKKYRNTLMDRDRKISTDFFIELYPIAFRLSAEEGFYYDDGLMNFVDGMIDKFKIGEVITDVKEFREIRKAMAYYEKTDSFDTFKKKIVTFVSDQNLGLDIFASADIETDKAIKNIQKYIGYLSANLETIDPELISDFYLVDQMMKLKILLEKIIDEID